jgi:hypothetical protein
MGPIIPHSRDSIEIWILKERKNSEIRGEKNEKDLGSHANGNGFSWQCIGSANSAGNTP